MRHKSEWDAFIRPRWSSWLTQQLERNKLAPEGLAKLIATNPGDIYTHPRAAVKGFLAGKRTVTADLAFRIGEALQLSSSEAGSEGSVCGPVALWAAGRYPMLIRFLGSLAYMPVRKRSLLPSSQTVVLFSTIWATDIGVGDLDKSTDPTLQYLDSQTRKARRLLADAISLPGARELYRDAWNPMRYAQSEQVGAAATIAQSVPPINGMLAAWHYLRAWAKEIDPNTFSNFAELLDAWDLSQTDYIHRLLAAEKRRARSTLL